MKFSIAAARNTAGLLCGLGFGLILMSPTASALGMSPVLSLVAPNAGASVSGNVTFAATADSDGLVSLQFKVDGNDYGPAITAGSCRTPFDSTAVSDGTHTVQAVGQDQFGAMVVSSPSTIYVSNSSPAVGGVSVYNVSTSSATVGWVTAMAADSQIEYGTSPSYGDLTARDWTPVVNHAQTIAGLTANTTYHFRVYSVGQNGILSLSGDFVFATASASTPPVPTPTPPVPTPTPPVSTPTPPVPTPTPPVPTPTPSVPTPTPTPTPSVPTPTPTPTPTVPTVPTPTPTPRPTLPTLPTPTPTPLVPTPTPTVSTSTRHLSTTLPNVRRSVPQVVVAPEPGTSGVPTTDRRQQPRIIDSGSATTAVARGGSTTPKSATPPAVTPTPTPKATPAPVFVPSVTIRGTTSNVPCTEPDPFKARGGVGMCVDNKWMALWLPAGGGKGK